jgi:hypothetical protein
MALASEVTAQALAALGGAGYSPAQISALQAQYGGRIGAQTAQSILAGAQQPMATGGGAVPTVTGVPSIDITSQAQTLLANAGWTQADIANTGLDRIGVLTAQKLVSGGKPIPTAGTTATTNLESLLNQILSASQAAQNIQYPAYPTAGAGELADFAARGQTAGETVYNPQLQEIVNALTSARTGAESQKGWTEAAYEPALKSIQDWAAKEKPIREADLARRGMYESGLFEQAMQDLSKNVLEQTVMTQTEKARALRDIATDLSTYEKNLASTTGSLTAAKAQYTQEYSRQLEDQWTQLQMTYGQGKFQAQYEQAANKIQNLLSVAQVKFSMEQFDWQKYTDKQQLSLSAAAQKLAEKQFAAEEKWRQAQWDAAQAAKTKTVAKTPSTYTLTANDIASAFTSTTEIPSWLQHGGSWG